MNPSASSHLIRLIFAIGLAVASTSSGHGGTDTVVVNARVFNGYTRTKLPDGSLKPERYGLAEGGRWDGKQVDPSLDQLPFKQIVQTIAAPLRHRGYLPTTDPQQTDLLILVFWGVTTGATGGEYDHAMPQLVDAMNAVADNLRNNITPSGGAVATPEDERLNSALLAQAMENRARDRNNLSNAGILGYTDAYVRARELREIGSPAGDNVINELEENRYFIVLKAYDFPSLRHKQMKLLWETRFSIYERGNRFDGQLLAMAQAASRYFGQDTDGLARTKMPGVKVEFGQTIVVETLEAPPRTEKRQPTPPPTSK